MLRFSGTKNLGEKIMQYLRKCPLRDVEIKKKRNEKQKKDRKEWDEARKRGSGDGISCSSILDREFERKSRSRLCHGGWPLIHGFSPKSLAACSRGQ